MKNIYLVNAFTETVIKPLDIYTMVRRKMTFRKKNLIKKMDSLFTQT